MQTSDYSQKIDIKGYLLTDSKINICHKLISYLVATRRNVKQKHANECRNSYQGILEGIVGTYIPYNSIFHRIAQFQHGAQFACFISDHQVLETH
jgi:hypothetical protein